MSEFTYLIVGDYDNYHIGSGGAYVHNRLNKDKNKAIEKAREAMETYDLIGVKVMEINTSTNEMLEVWERQI